MLERRAVSYETPVQCFRVASQFARKGKATHHKRLIFWRQFENVPYVALRKQDKVKSALRLRVTDSKTLIRLALHSRNSRCKSLYAC